MHNLASVRVVGFLCWMVSCVGGIAVAEGPTISGERLDPATYGPAVIESMEQVMARERQAAAQEPKEDPKARNGAQGAWMVPSRRATYYPHSGSHNVVNKWGDTRMAIGFPAPVDVQGAYFAGQAGKGAWTTAVRAIGYRNGLVAQKTDWFWEIGREPKWFEMNLPNVDRIVITSVSVLQGGGWYGMDDLTFTVLPGTGEQRPRPTVIDFEDSSYNTPLTGSGYAGLTWETGTGNFDADQAIHHPFVPQTEQDSESTGAAGAEMAPSQTEAAIPRVEMSFQGSKMYDGGSGSYPPDTMGAVGPDHFVVTVNGVFAVYDKTTGSRIMHSGLGAFLPGSSGDPRVLFDQHSGRWVVIVSNFNNRTYLAVSLTDDPTGSWFKTYFVVSAGSDQNCWPDYPTLGVDVNGIYSSAYMVGCDMTIFAIDKAPLIDPSPSLGTITAFRGLTWEGAIQPVHTYGDPGGEYFVSVRSNNYQIRVRRVNPPLTSPTLTTLGSISVGGWSSPPDAPAPDTDTDLDTVGDRLMMAVYRDGSIWTTHAVSVSGRSACRWYELDPGAVDVVQSGTVSDYSLYYFFPSIMVNAEGSVVMGFTGSNAASYPSTYYTGRLSTDPLGAMALPALLHQGEASQNLIDGPGRNRYGDYSQTTLDPVDEFTIWTIQEYNSSYNIWSTWIASLVLSDCNGNGIADQCDVDCGPFIGACNVPGCGGSDDCNGNFVPDECEPDEDCNVNGVQDICDISAGTSKDCNFNGIPDECSPCTDNCECTDGDVCTLDLCTDGVCSSDGADIYGDVNHDGAKNVFDLFCILNGFGGDFTGCFEDELDIEPCEGNGVVNVFDLFAVLNAFGGTDPCCGG